MKSWNEWFSRRVDDRRRVANRRFSIFMTNDGPINIDQAMTPTEFNNFIRLLMADEAGEC